MYFQVKFNYQREVTKYKNDKSVFGDENVKTVAVLLTPNEKLNGSMPYNVFRSFKEYVTSHQDIAIIIVGSVGEALYSASGLNLEHQTFELLYGKTFEEDLLNLTYVLQEFEEVLIFHGQFESLIDQESVVTSLRGDPFASEDKEKSKDAMIMNKTSFLFEPGIKEVVDFFDSQVRYSLLRQSVHESRLAQYASRASAMDEALENLNVRHKMLSLKSKRSKRFSKDKAQLEQLNSILSSF